ncbi:unnamed protein product [Blepharisma stoltei]|uniref:Uncharacterized protein n=1 Tax=Blepharisma stoltei TaxID=1481888 RepID=A0AAU9JZ53_9CILI|nr:unnamed protein product [Blepharisma stoltei]
MKLFRFHLAEYRFSKSKHLKFLANNQSNFSQSSRFFKETFMYPKEILLDYYRDNNAILNSIADNDDKLYLIKTLVKCSFDENLAPITKTSLSLKEKIEIAKHPKFKDQYKNEIIANAASLTIGESAVAAWIYDNEPPFSDKLLKLEGNFETYEELLYFLRVWLHWNIESKDMEKYAYAQFLELYRNQGLDNDIFLEICDLLTQYWSFIGDFIYVAALFNQNLLSFQLNQFEKALKLMCKFQCWLTYHVPYDNIDLYLEKIQIQKNFSVLLSICESLLYLKIKIPEKFLQYIYENFFEQNLEEIVKFLNLCLKIDGNKNSIKKIVQVISVVWKESPDFSSIVKCFAAFSGHDVDSSLRLEFVKYIMKNISQANKKDIFDLLDVCSHSRNDTKVYDKAIERLEVLFPTLNWDETLVILQIFGRLVSENYQMKRRINMLIEEKIIENYDKINFFNVVHILHHFAFKWYSKDICNMILKFIEIMDKGLEMSNTPPPESSLYFKENSVYYIPNNEILNKLTSGALATVIESFFFRCERPPYINTIMENYLKALINSKWRILTEKHKLKLFQLISLKENRNESITKIIVEKISQEPIHLTSLKEAKIYNNSTKSISTKEHKDGKTLKY